jgi:phosphohistidine swiveling domain-containing protein
MMATLSENSKGDGTPKAPTLPVTTLLQKLPRHLSLLVRPLLKSTCEFLNLREDLRFFLDKILYRVRQSLLTVGKHTGLGEDVLFLTQSELEQMVDGRIDFDHAKNLAVDRRKTFLEKTDVYTFYIDGRPIDELPSQSQSKIIRGIGTSPGRATGRARIVDDPTKHGIMKGDILVAKNTDPGWTPVLGIVSGIVVEEGGILNHCSIVARELGIPAVVGVRQATKKIRENALITIDGGLGAVQPAEGVSRRI